MTLSEVLKHKTWCASTLREDGLLETVYYDPQKKAWFKHDSKMIQYSNTIEIHEEDAARFILKYSTAPNTRGWKSWRKKF